MRHLHFLPCELHMRRSTFIATVAERSVCTRTRARCLRTLTLTVRTVGRGQPLGVFAASSGQASSGSARPSESRSPVFTGVVTTGVVVVGWVGLGVVVTGAGQPFDVAAGCVGQWSDAFGTPSSSLSGAVPAARWTATSALARPPVTL